MSLADLYLKRLLLIGPPSSGKSTTGNNLLERNFFTTGDRLNRVTTEGKIRSHQNGLTIRDFPGFGSDMHDDDVF
jgi:adenylate kinase family enzyme